MTQDPSNPPDNSRLPPRHRVSLEQLRKDAVESDLWDLDETPSTQHTEPLFDEPLEMDMPIPSEPAPQDIDEYTESEQPDPEQESAPDPIETPESRPLRPHSSMIDDLGDLDDWDDSEVPLPTSPIAGVSAAELLAEPAETHAPTPAEAPAKPTSGGELPHRKSFSRNDIIAMSSVLAALVLLSGFFMINALKGLPRSVDPYQEPDLPAEGDHFQVKQIRTYWRAPITTGPDADTVQRGTELMPILEVVAVGKDAALRVQFRNSEGMAVGDPITRAVRGETTLEILSTAGLEDINTHNAYRTGLIEPWTVEILEASAGTTSGNSFQSLITVPISPDRQ